MEKIIYCNVGWMAHYRGLSGDSISGGGSYPAERKHEIYNFEPVNGMCYGYVQPSGNTIDIQKRFGAAADAESIKDVLVVWVAPNPQGGRYIVGWFKHAEVFRKYKIRPGKIKYSYFMRAKCKDCVCLPCYARNFYIPSGKNCFGRSHVWYGNDDVNKEVIKYIKNYKQFKNSTRRKHITNVELNKRIEKASVNYVTKVYKKRGFDVISVEKENKGWDLEARKGKIVLYLEVKGKGSGDIYVQLSPNEFSKMEDEIIREKYCLCVVNNALNKNTISLSTFIFDNGTWVNEDDSTMKLHFEKIVSAVVTLD